jgi:long-chain acyl-CoA synthetase
LKFHIDMATVYFGMTEMPDLPVELLNFWDQARRRQDDPAIVDGDGATLTFGEVAALATQIANYLGYVGLRRGDSVSIVSANHPHWMVVYLAALESGLYFTPLSPSASREHLGTVWRDCGTTAVVAGPGCSDEVIVACDDVGILPERRCGIGDSPFPALTASVGAIPANYEAPRSAGIRVLYTGGTTGRPKRVANPLPEVSPEEAATVVARGPLRLGFPSDASAHLVAGPLYHGGPLAFATGALHLGSTLIVPATWSSEEVLRLIEQYGVETTFLVPTMMVRLLDLPPSTRERYDVSSVRSVVHGAAPCPPAVKHRMFDWLGPVIHEFYGATEAALGTRVGPDEWLAHPGTVGRADPVDAIRVVREDGSTCSPGEVGNVMLPSRVTGELIWPGDVGYLDDEGYLFLTDRAENVIITGGVNVYSTQIEAELARFPGLSECAVVGVSDGEWGQSVTAVVVGSWGDAEWSSAESALESFARRRLSPPQRPKRYLRVDSLPMTAVGKVDKRAVRQLVEQASGTP